MVKDKAINVKPYKMERNGKEILVSGHSRQAKGVNKEFPVKGSVAKFPITPDLL